MQAGSVALIHNQPILEGGFCPGIPYKHSHRPLFIGCSGGAGHNSAIVAIRSYLDDLELLASAPAIPSYKPRIHFQRRDIKGVSLIELASFLSNDLPILSAQFRKMLSALKTPNVPAKVPDEVCELIESQIKMGHRHYIDMLLDVYPAGYEHAAIWNIIQREDRLDEISRMLPLRSYVDKQHYKTVYDYYLNKLLSAQDFNLPFTEVISTQVLGIEALCDAVIAYNRQLSVDGKPVKIHQYLTDLPTEQAIHFFGALQKLSKIQREQICLYGVNIKEYWPKVSATYSLASPQFYKLINIDPKDNPMVRKGFKKRGLRAMTIHYPVNLEVQSDAGASTIYKIEANEKIASIMLGSQASDDTVDYVLSLAADEDLAKIFVFGGAKPRIKFAVEAKLEAKNHHAKIIYLSNQDDDHIAPIMTRSNIIITRCGGLSVMEQMAIPHQNKGQLLYLHCKSDEFGVLSSGIDWEDGNADALRFYLKSEAYLKNIRRTSTDIFYYHMRAMQQGDDNFDAVLRAPRVNTRGSDGGGDSDEQSAELRSLLNEMSIKDMLAQLHIEMSELPESTGYQKNYRDALQSLHKKLHDNYHEDAASNNKVAHIARETIVMVRKMKLHDASSREVRLKILDDYTKSCYQPAKFKFFMKVVATVVITGVGCVLGAAIGVGVGIALGAWAGPAANVTGLVGLFQGLTVGTKVGLAASAAVTGLAAGSCSARMFKKNELAKEVQRFQKLAVSALKNSCEQSF